MRRAATIAVEGIVDNLLPRGACQVRLENGPVIRALPPLSGQLPIPGLGEPVIAEIALKKTAPPRTRTARKKVLPVTGHQTALPSSPGKTPT